MDWAQPALQLPVLVLGQEQERTGDGHRHNWHGLGWGSGCRLSLPACVLSPVSYFPCAHQLVPLSTLL